MNELKEKQFEEMYKLIDEWTKRNVWKDERFLTVEGHLGFCSKGFGPPEECHICGLTYRAINILNEIDLSNTRQNNEC